MADVIVHGAFDTGERPAQGSVVFTNKAYTVDPVTGRIRTGKSYTEYLDQNGEFWINLPRGATGTLTTYEVQLLIPGHNKTFNAAVPNVSRVIELSQLMPPVDPPSLETEYVKSLVGMSGDISLAELQEAVAELDPEAAKDNYQLWLEQGNSGTLQQFFNTLRGPQGLVGAKGDKGDAGVQGVVGPIGPTGPQGERFTITVTAATSAQFPNPTLYPQGAFAADANLNLFMRVGSAWQQLGSMKGPQGVQGPLGSAGPQGPQGLQGIQGPAGTNGIDGTNAPLVSSVTFDETGQPQFTLSNGSVVTSTGWDPNYILPFRAEDIGGPEVIYRTNYAKGWGYNFWGSRPSWNFSDDGNGWISFTTPNPPAGGNVGTFSPYGTTNVIPAGFSGVVSIPFKIDTNQPAITFDVSLFHYASNGAEVTPRTAVNGTVIANTNVEQRIVVPFTMNNGANAIRVLVYPKTNATSRVSMGTPYIGKPGTPFNGSSAQAGRVLYRWTGAAGSTTSEAYRPASVNLRAELDTKSNNGHTHTISQITSLSTELANKSDVGHNHQAVDLINFAAAVREGGSQAIEVTGTGIDLNTFETPGLYSISTTTNAANGVNFPAPIAGMLEVNRAGTTTQPMIYQRFVTYGSTTVSGQGQYTDTFQRGRYQGNWAAWKRLSRDSDFAHHSRYLATSYTVTTSSTYEPIPFDSLVHNSGEVTWDTTNNAFVLHRSGLWQINAGARFNSIASTGGSRILRILANNTSIAATFPSFPTGSSWHTTQVLSRMRFLGSGTLVRIQAYSDTGNNTLVVAGSSAQYTYADVTFMGAYGN